MKYPYVKRLPKFEFLAPKTVNEAVSMLAQHKDEARVLAGGTDLLDKMKRRDVIPNFVIGLKSIPGLDYIAYDGTKGLRFGPLVTIHEMETSPVVKDKFPVLFQAASSMASVQIRNLGTVVGNITSAVPSADMAPGLIVLGAKLKVANAKGERIVPVADFFAGPSKSVLARDEMVVEIEVPNPPPSSGMAYIKHTIRDAMELAIVGVAAMVSLKDGVCSEVKVALGAVAPTPIRAAEAEAILRGKPFKSDLIKKAAEAASEEARPISDIRASAEYRKEMVRVLSERALNKAGEQIKS